MAEARYAGSFTQSESWAGIPTNWSSTLMQRNPNMVDSSTAGRSATGGAQSQNNFMRVAYGLGPLLEACSNDAVLIGASDRDELR
jgi:hypothetical protein